MSNSRRTQSETRGEVLRFRPVNQVLGFLGVLKRDQWKGVVDFSKAVDAGIVTSFATSVGARGTAGLAPEQAKRLLDYTKSVGNHIAAAEFMNEPTFARDRGAPAGYDAAAYGDIDAYWTPAMR